MSGYSMVPEPTDPTPGFDPTYLVARIREGDATAFELLFRHYYAALLNFAASFVSDRDLAQDLVQQVFGWVWTHRSTWNPPGEPFVYLLTAVRHRALDRLRDERRHEGLVMRYIGPAESPGMGTADETASDSAEQLAAVWAVIRGLPQSRRTVLMLRWQQELDWPEVAQIMGISVAAARVQHSRALQVLRERLASLR